MIYFEVVIKVLRLLEGGVEYFVMMDVGIWNRLMSVMYSLWEVSSGIIGLFWSMIDFFEVFFVVVS